MNNLVFICSPLKGDVEANINNAKQYARDAVLSGYIPVAPHVYFTSFLDDSKLDERQLGINCGSELLKYCNEVWVYGSTITDGMRQEINIANNLSIPVKFKV